MDAPSADNAGDGTDLEAWHFDPVRRPPVDVPGPIAAPLIAGPDDVGGRPPVFLATPPGEIGGSARAGRPTSQAAHEEVVSAASVRQELTQIGWHAGFVALLSAALVMAGSIVMAPMPASFGEALTPASLLGESIQSLRVAIGSIDAVRTMCLTAFGVSFVLFLAHLLVNALGARRSSGQDALDAARARAIRVAQSWIVARLAGVAAWVGACACWAGMLAGVAYVGAAANAAGAAVCAIAQAGFAAAIRPPEPVDATSTRTPSASARRVSIPVRVPLIVTVIQVVALIVTIVTISGSGAAGAMPGLGGEMLVRELVIVAEILAIFVVGFVANVAVSWQFTRAKASAAPLWFFWILATAVIGMAVGAALAVTVIVTWFGGISLSNTLVTLGIVVAMVAPLINLFIGKAPATKPKPRAPGTAVPAQAIPVPPADTVSTDLVPADTFLNAARNLAHPKEDEPPAE